MSNLTCPKCGGSDSFISQRNIVKGRGIYQSGKMRGVAVCRVCDEIMHTSDSYKQIQKMRYTTQDKTLYAISIIFVLVAIFTPGSTLGLICYVIPFPIWIYLYRTWNKQNREVIRRTQENKE